MRKIRQNSKISLSTEIYQSIKDDILWLRLKPGEMLTEQYLADIFKTSKTPVREALAKLASDNLVTVLPHKGYMITDITYSDLFNLFQYRCVLECGSIEYIAQKATEEQLNHLNVLAGKLQPYKSEDPAFTTFSTSNTDFHLYLMAILDNPFLQEAYAKVIEQMQRFLWVSTSEDIVGMSIKEHFELVQLIRDKKVTEAQKLMRKHITDVLESGMEKKKKGLL